MKITLCNRQNRYPINRVELRSLAAAFAARLTRVRPDISWASINVVLTGERGIARINRKALGHQGSTDVVTFRLDPIPGETPPMPSAEIIVNLQRAWERGMIGRPGGWSPSKELALYLAHGFNHLSGWNDDVPAAAARMRRRELRWIRQVGIRDCFRGIASRG